MAMEWFGFGCGRETLAISARYLQRVLDRVAVTPVPLMPACHCGLAYDRGEVYDVIDMEILLGNRQGALQGDNIRMILLKHAQHKLGLLTDSVFGLIPLNTAGEHPAFITFGDNTFRVVTPDLIWSLLMGLPYGPDQI